MDLEPVIFSDLQPNFLNLSLLICQLFAGGNFRMAHILYHQEAFDDRLLTAIDSACPHRIPKMTTDISTSGPFEIPQIERTDYILQLIFLPREQLKGIMDRIGGLLAFYRVFIFASDPEPDSEQKWMADVKYISNLNSSSLLLIQNEKSGALSSYLLSKNLMNISMEPVDLQSNNSKSEKDLFDLALGDKAIGRYFGVSYIDQIDCSILSPRQDLVELRKHMALGRFYFNHLNIMSSMDACSIHCDFEQNSKRIYATYKAVRPIKHPIYNELVSDFETIQMEPKWA